VICRREGYRGLEVPIFSYPRHGGSTTMRYRSAVKVDVGAYRLRQVWPR
jgi:hypothetical protein